MAANNTETLRQEPLPFPTIHPPKHSDARTDKTRFTTENKSWYNFKWVEHRKPLFLLLEIKLLLWWLTRRWLCKEVKVHGIKARVPRVGGLCRGGSGGQLGLVATLA